MPDSRKPQSYLERPHVVIVGGGFGGLKAARALKRAPVRVTLIDQRNHHLFQPLLYQVATAALSPADIAAPIRNILRYQRNADVLLAEVTGVDVSRKLVQMGDKALQYDYLILATGSCHSYFGHDEWSRFAPGLKTVTDATRIRRSVLLAFEAAEMESDEQARKAELSFVLVGAGPTGVEMAGAIAELAHHVLRADFRHIDPAATRIVLVEAAPRILGAFPESLAQKAREQLQRLGVEVMTGAPVEKIDSEGVVIRGERIASRTVIWTAGVAASAAARWLGAESDRSGRVKVRPDLSVPGHPEIYAIGDTAHLVPADSRDGRPLPGLAPVAMQQGVYVAKSIHARLQGEGDVAPFRYRDKGNLATIGRSQAIADLGWARLTGFVAWVAWLVVHIYYLIGFRNRMIVMIEWAWAYLTFQRGARLITESVAEVAGAGASPTAAGAERPRDERSARMAGGQ